MVRAVRMHAMLAMLATMAGRAAGANTPPTTGCHNISGLGNVNAELSRVGYTSVAPTADDTNECDATANRCTITCKDGFELYNGDSDNNLGTDTNNIMNTIGCVKYGAYNFVWHPEHTLVYCVTTCGNQYATSDSESSRLTGASVTDPGTCEPCVSGTWAAADADNCVPHTESCAVGFTNTAAPTATSDLECIEYQCTAGSDEIYKRWGCNVSNPTATTFNELGTVGNLPGHICTIEPCASENSDFEVYTKCAVNYHVENGTCVACESGTHNDAENTLGGIGVTDYADTICFPHKCRDNKTIAEWNDLGCSGGVLGGNSLVDWDSIGVQEVYMLTPYGPADGYATCTITCPQNDGEFAVTATCAADYHVQAGKCVVCAGGATRDEGDSTANGDTHCSCGAGTWAATNTAVCTPCNTIACTIEEYMETACTATSDRVCTASTECPDGQSETTAPTATTDRACAENECAARTDDDYMSFGCIVGDSDATTISGLGNFSSATGYVCSIQPCVTSGSVFSLNSSCAENYRVQAGTCVACEDGTHNAAGGAFYNGADTTCDDNVCTQKPNAEWTGLGCKDVSNATLAGDAAASVTVTSLGDYEPAEGYGTCAITCPDNNGEFEVTAKCNAETHYESVAPTSTSDRGCTAVSSNCIAGHYESAAPTPTSDRECEECTTFNFACAECSAINVCTKCSGKTHLAPPSPNGNVGCDPNPACHTQINQDNCTAHKSSGLDHSLEPDTRCADATCTVEECCTPNVGCGMNDSLSCGDGNDSWSKHAIGNAEGFAQCSGLDPASCKPADCCITPASGGFAADIIQKTDNYSITVGTISDLEPEPGGTVRYVNGAAIVAVDIVFVAPSPPTDSFRARRDAADAEFAVTVGAAINAAVGARVEVHPKAQPSRKSKKTKKVKKANSTVNYLVIIGGVLAVVAVIVVVAAVICKSHKDDYIRFYDANSNTMVPGVVP